MRQFSNEIELELQNGNQRSQKGRLFTGVDSQPVLTWIIVQVGRIKPGEWAEWNSVVDIPKSRKDDLVGP